MATQAEALAEIQKLTLEDAALKERIEYGRKQIKQVTNLLAKKEAERKEVAERLAQAIAALQTPKK